MDDTTVYFDNEKISLALLNTKDKDDMSFITFIRFSTV